MYLYTFPIEPSRKPVRIISRDCYAAYVNLVESSWASVVEIDRVFCHLLPSLLTFKQFFFWFKDPTEFSCCRFIQFKILKTPFTDPISPFLCCFTDPISMYVDVLNIVGYAFQRGRVSSEIVSVQNCFFFCSVKASENSKHERVPVDILVENSKQKRVPVDIFVEKHHKRRATLEWNFIHRPSDRFIIEARLRAPIMPNAEKR